MKTRTLPAGIALLAVAGCAAPPKPPMQFLPPHLTITDANLASVITPMKTTESVDAYGMRTVTLPLKLKADGDVYVDYRFTFLDAEHKPQDDNPKWETTVLHPGATETLTGTSPKPGSTDYAVEVRPNQQ